MKKFLFLLLAVPMLLSLTACGAPEPKMMTVYAMDTVMNLTAYGKDAEAALSEAEELLYQLDALLDRHDENSAVSALNRGGYTTSADLTQLLTDAVYLSQATGGAFDPTLAPVIDAWGFGTDTPGVPAEEKLTALLEQTGTDGISFSNGHISATLDGGVQIDLGGIAKGYAGDCVKEIFKNHGCTGVIDLGGDVMLVGSKADGSDWRIAVKNPNEPSSFLGTLTASDCAIVTSGIYERNFEQDGVLYHHIIDPATGKSAQSGLVSVTVVCDYGETADALSTALFVMGAERAAAQYRSASETADAFEMILVTDDDRVLYTPGLDGKFEPDTESGYTYECLA